MQIDFARIHAWIIKQVECNLCLEESMERLVDLCESMFPHPDWRQLGNINFSDLSTLIHWIEKLNRFEPPDQALNGLWFGLANPTTDRGEVVADLYVSGSTHFVADEQDLDWAMNPQWYPRDGFANSSVLASIYRIAYPSVANQPSVPKPLGNNAEYPMALGYGVFAVHEILRRVDVTSWNRSEPIGVAVGFDGGDFVLIGTISSSGWTLLNDIPREPFDSIDFCLSVLRSSSEDRKIRALKALARKPELPTTVCEEILSWTKAESVPLRQAAMATLVSVAAGQSGTRSAVMDALRDQDAILRREALQAISKLEGLTREDLEIIESLQKDRDPGVAFWAKLAAETLRLRL